MADPEPRTRTAAQIADDAARLLDEAQRFSYSMLIADEGPTSPIVSAQGQRIIALLERLAGQLEDLAAAVVRERRRNDDLHDQRG